MEYILIHTPNSNYTAAMFPAMLEMGKTVLENPEEMAPGCKMLAAYAGRTKLLMFCIWEAPSADNLVPGMEQMAMYGWDTDIIPADKLGVRLEKLAKFMEAMPKG
jgi:hypothetical protein